MSEQDIPRPRQQLPISDESLLSLQPDGPEPWPQPGTDLRDNLMFLWPERRHLYTMRMCGPSTEGQDVTIVPGVPIGVIATALLLLQPGDVATIECVEAP